MSKTSKIRVFFDNHALNNDVMPEGMNNESFQGSPLDESSLQMDETMENESVELDINFVLQLVLEGVHRGVGMDRGLVSFIEHTSGKLVGKYAVQDRNTNLARGRVFLSENLPTTSCILNCLEYR